MAGGELATAAAGAVSVDLLLFVVVGLLAGAHCLGMCGPLVSVYAERIGADQPEQRVTTVDVRQHGLFNLGRTAGYAVVGGVLGLAGSLVVGTAATLAPISTAVRGTVGVAVGALIVAAGAGYLLRGTQGASVANLPVFGRAFARLSGLLTERVDRLAGSPRIAGLGAVHALLPCPIIYPAYLYAFAVGDPVHGAVALGLVGLGTIPTLLAYGLAVGSLSVGRRAQLHRALGVAFLLLGYLPLAHGLMLFGVSLPSPDIPFYQPLA